MIQIFSPKPKSIECYGRNGYFWLKEYSVMCGEESNCLIDFFSRIKTGNVPMQIMGGKADLVELLTNLLSQLEEE